MLIHYKINIKADSHYSTFVAKQMSVIGHWYSVPEVAIAATEVHKREISMQNDRLKDYINSTKSYLLLGQNGNWIITTCIRGSCRGYRVPKKRA